MTWWNGFATGVCVVGGVLTIGPAVILLVLTSRWKQ